MSRALSRRSELSAPLAKYERMLEIREFEKRTNELFAAGSIRGTTHLCVGQEALAVGLASVLRTDDVLAGTYRSHGIALALGMTPETVMSEIMGKATGCAGGIGGSMHMCDSSIGLLPTSAIIGGGMPIAVGAALAFKNLKQKRVAVSMFGDGATNIGAFHESLNLASIWKLPVVFLIDNNVYGEYSRINTTTPIEDLHIRAESYAMYHEKFDGMKIEIVEERIGAALERARNGEGPSLIEAKTYRFSGHSRADTAPYRPAGELESWQSKDPILLTEQKYKSEGILTDAKIEEMKNEMVKTIESVVQTSQKAPEPELSKMFKNIFESAK